MVTDGRWLSQTHGRAHTHTHNTARARTHTNLIPNKHHEVIMYNLPTALFFRSAWLSRHPGVEMQTQALDSLEACGYYYRVKSAEIFCTSRTKCRAQWHLWLSHWRRRIPFNLRMNGFPDVCMCNVGKCGEKMIDKNHNEAAQIEAQWKRLH